MHLNLDRMQTLANQNGKNLRPHVKTHKSPALALLQMQKGAVGIATANLNEAKIMADAGIKDIQVANEVLNPISLERFYELNQSIRITCAVDSRDGVNALNDYFQESGFKAKVLIDIDTGLSRTGLKPDRNVLEFIRYVDEKPALQRVGLMTHAGHAYGADSLKEVERIGNQEGDQMADLDQQIKGAGLQSGEVSVGSTPTAPFSVKNPEVSELRVGNYIFYDRTQVALGSTGEPSCALTVLATVISIPEPGRAVIDAGSKSLTVDQGAHGKEQVKGFGKLYAKKGFLERLSEEHGVITYDPKETAFSVGEMVQILPNHACPVMNLFDKAYLVEKGQLIDTLIIEARGHGN